MSVRRLTMAAALLYRMKNMSTQAAVCVVNMALQPSESSQRLLYRFTRATELSVLDVLHNHDLNSFLS